MSCYLSAFFLPRVDSEEAEVTYPLSGTGDTECALPSCGKWVLEKMERGSEELFTTIFEREPSVAWQGTALMISKKRDASFTEGFNKAGGIWDVERTSF